MEKVTVYQTKSGTYTKRRAANKYEWDVLGNEQYARDLASGAGIVGCMPVLAWGVKERNKIRQVFNGRAAAREYRRTHCPNTGTVVALGVMAND